MIIVITPEELVQNETGIINELFREGLDVLHIRKPFINRDEIADFIQNFISKKLTGKMIYINLLQIK